LLGFYEMYQTAEVMRRQESFFHGLRGL
jgi:hypothetical protein